MSSGVHESLWSFESSRSLPRRRTAVASSSGDSSASPGSSIRTKEATTSALSQPNRPSRPPLLRRTYENQLKDSMRVQGIEEGGQLQAQKYEAKDSHRLPHSQLSELPSAKPLPDVVISGSKPSSVGTNSPTLSESITPGSPSPSGGRHGSRPSWARTRSGDVWHRSSRQVSGETDSNRASSEHNEAALSKPMPLTGPARFDRPQTAPTHHVTVETPFSRIEAKGYFESIARRDSVDSTKVQTSRRHPSVDSARRLFSAPFLGLRMKVKEKPAPVHEALNPPKQEDVFLSPGKAKCHKSLLRGDHTASTLERVSTLLSSHKSLVHRHRTATTKSPSSTNSSGKDEGRQKIVRSYEAAWPSFRRRSSDDLAYASSSLLDIHRGSTPQNSPAEAATYQIKRDSSTRIETFLKIDISVRGQTSYLPSEARRIHTPPLPADNDHGQTRGFFFDYNDPECRASCEHLMLAPAQPTLKPPPQENTKTKPPLQAPLVQRVATKLNIHGLALRSPTADLRTTIAKSKTFPKAKTGEWYEDRLADLDASTSKIDVAKADSQHPKRECQSNMAEMKRQEYEAQLDYDIPEHLPSSPLCPRNPKYWRVVRNKGSQFRGCWMHGYGEYDVVPGLFRGGAIAQTSA